MEDRNFIDGDLIEQFTDLSPKEKTAIFEEIRDHVDSMDSLIKVVEELARSH